MKAEAWRLFLIKKRKKRGFCESKGKALKELSMKCIHQQRLEREQSWYRVPYEENQLILDVTDAQKWFKELGSFKVWKTYRATSAKGKYTVHHLLKNNNEETKRELKTYRGQEQNPQDTLREGFPDVIAIEHTG